MKTDFTIELRALLEQALKPKQMEITDDSAAHAGHGAKGGHYHLQISSDQFEDKTTIQCHRMIHHIVQDAFQHGVIHALSINIIR